MKKSKPKQKGKKTLPTEFTQLSTTVANLPTQADLATKLSTTGGELTGELQMNNFRIGDLGPALHANDAVRNTEFQSFKQEVASNYIPISNPVFNGLVVTLVES